MTTPICKKPWPDDPFIGIEPKHGRKNEDRKRGKKTGVFSGLDRQVAKQVNRADPQKEIQENAMNRFGPQSKVKIDGFIGIQDRDGRESGTLPDGSGGSGIPRPRHTRSSR